MKILFFTHGHDPNPRRINPAKAKHYLGSLFSELQEPNNQVEKYSGGHFHLGGPTSSEPPSEPSLYEAFVFYFNFVSPKKNVVIAQDHNAKQKMLCKTGFECVDRWADIIIDRERALNLCKTTKEERECQDVKTILHNICDDKPGLRGPFVFGIRAKKLSELENTILFLKDMENISTFKKMSLIFNSKRKKVNGISLKKRQKKTICIYVQVEDITQIQEVLKRYEEKWSHIISYCQIRDDEN